MKMGLWAKEDPRISYSSRRKEQGREQSPAAQRASATDASLCPVCVQAHLTLLGALGSRATNPLCTQERWA